VAKILYKGTADVVRIEKGHDFHGRLADSTTKDVVWNWDNNHLVDTDEFDLSAEAVELILEDKDRFQDVTDLKRIPASGPAKLWRSAPGENNPNIVNTEVDTGASAVGTATTTVGGSTAGATTTGARGGRGGARGGSGTD
jgi:hypothetical protein